MAYLVFDIVPIAPFENLTIEVKPSFALASTGGSAGKDVDFKGTVFGAVDCDMEEQLCQDFNIQNYLLSLYRYERRTF